MTIQRATFAAGCFWGVQTHFTQIHGIITTQVGYIGGKTLNPTYEQVCYTDTGHAEAVDLTFDDTIITYEQLLDKFWEMHDPTTIDRQGPDVGSQYRSAIFTYSKSQEKTAKESRTKCEKLICKKIVTQITSATTFYRAEEYHQDYAEKRKKRQFGIF